MKICVYGASSTVISDSYIAAGEELGRKMADRGHSLVFGGGANGMMGAVARGMTEGKGITVGVVPGFLNIDGILYDKCTEMIYTNGLRDRKQKMDDLSDAFLITAGGIGTFDEFFEVLTLRQLGRHARPIGILNTNGYFNYLLDLLKYAADEGFVNASVLEALQISEDPGELLDKLEAHLGELPHFDKTVETKN